MNIGIVCYASVGGSGVVASELARCLADRGHRTHVISSDTPFRLRDSNSDVRFHRVETPGYPVFREPQYLLALTNRLVQVARAYRLDIIHAHYAIPHAAAAYLARQILASAGNAPRTITTLHGTDVTILGADPSYRETVAFCIDQSDAVTAVSASLREDTKREMPVKSDIVVIPNFLDCGFHRRTTDPQLRSRFCAPDEKLVIHISNLRPVKQVDAVARVFAQIRKRMAARLLIVGEGPDLGRAERLIDELGITAHVELVGEARDVVGLLSVLRRRVTVGARDVSRARWLWQHCWYCHRCGLVSLLTPAVVPQLLPARRLSSELLGLAGRLQWRPTAPSVHGHMPKKSQSGRAG